MSAHVDRGFTRLAHGLVHFREKPARDDAADITPLLLLHASPSSGRSMEPIMNADTSGRRLLALDTPGNGNSDPLAVSAPQMSDYADAVAGFCDAQGLATVDVLGSHTGAHIAVELAGRRPELVRGIAADGLLTLTDAERADYLANYAPPKTPDETGSQFHWVWQYVRDQMIFFPHFKKDLDHLRAGGIFDPQFLHEMALDLLNNLESYHLAYEAVFKHDLVAALRSVSCPLRWLDTGQGYLDDAIALVRQHVDKHSIVELSHDPAAFAAAMTEFSAEL